MTIHKSMGSEQMFGRVLAVLGVTIALMGSAVPVMADPPPESGVVVRPPDEGGFGMLNDDENGYFVFVNVTREGFCDWLAGGPAGPPPVLSTYNTQLVTGKKAGPTVRADGAAPTALHAVRDGATFDDGPCVGAEEDPSFLGEIKDRLNVNGNKGRGAFSGAGTVYDVDTGAPYFYSYKVNIFFESGKVVAQQYNLHRIGK